MSCSMKKSLCLIENELISNIYTPEQVFFSHEFVTDKINKE